MAYILEFLDLVDTPSTFSSQAGKIAVVNSGENALEFVTGVNANKLDGKGLSAPAPAAGDVLVYDGTVDNRWESMTPPWLRLDGGTMTGYITLHANPSNNMHAVTKQYVDNNFSPVGHDHDGDYIQSLGGTPVAGNLIEISDYDTVLDSGISSDVVEDALAVFPLVGWPTGAPADFIADTSLGFDNGTRTFTLTVSDNVTYWIQGREYSLSSGANPTIQIPDTEAEYFIYLKTDGTLGYTTTWTSAVLLEGNLYLTDIYWDAVNNEYLFMLDERHMFMPPSVHLYIHRRFSAYIESGFALGDISADENGSLDAHATMSVASGVLVDEDRDHSFAGASSPAQIPVFYLSGSTPVLRRFTATNAPVVKGTDRIYYNQFSGGSWGLAEVGQLDYCYVWILATNDPNQPIIAVMGQATYGTRPAAQDAALSEVSSIISLLPFEETAFIGGVLYQSSTTYSNTWAARIVSTSDGADYYDLRQSRLGSGAAPTSHAALSDRDLSGQHPDSAISLSGTHAGLLSGLADLDDVMTALDDISDVDIPLSGSVVDAYTGLLAAATTVKDAMDVLDPLDDSDIPMSAAKTGWLFAASGGDVHDALATIDAFRSNGVIFANDVPVKWTNAAGTGTLSGLKVNTSDQLEAYMDLLLPSGDWLLGKHSTSGFLYLIGTSSDSVIVGSGTYGTRIASGGNLLLSPAVDVEVTGGSVQTVNNEGFTAKETGGTARNLAKVDSSNVAVFGDAALSSRIYSNGTTRVMAARLMLDNDYAIQGVDTGFTARNVGKVNSSNEVEVGDANLPMALAANGTIDAGANDIETTGDVDCANTIADFDRATKSTTLTSGSGITFLKLPLDLNKAASCEVYWEVEAAKSGTVEFCSGNARFSVKRLSGGTTVTSVTEWGRDNGLAGAMTVTLATSNASIYEGRMQITATTSTTGMTITLRVRCMSASETQPVWNF